jgi:hypothetical protein
MNIGNACATAALLGFASLSSGAVLAAPSVLVSPDVSGPVRSFCSDAVKSVGTYGFHDYKLRLDAMKGLFTDAGWKRHVNALDHANTFDSMVAGHLLQTTEIDEAGCTIIEDNTRDGQATWTVRATAVRSFFSPGQKTNLTIEITMHLTRPGQAVLIDEWVEGPI